MKKWVKSHTSIRQYELLRGLHHEWKRWLCRIKSPKEYRTNLTKLHLGSGSRHISGWFNVNIVDSDLNLDIAMGKLPFANNHFTTIVSQHVAEHLTIEDEFIPLLKECHRCLKHKGELWVSTPDMEKIARSYFEQKNVDMIEDRKSRIPTYNTKGLPTQHFMNDIFHQQSEHRNLFDFDLLQWTLEQAGFNHIERSDEKTLLRLIPEFPPRHDDYQSLYVVAIKKD